MLTRSQPSMILDIVDNALTARYPEMVFQTIDHLPSGKESTRDRPPSQVGPKQQNQE